MKKRPENVIMNRCDGGDEKVDALLKFYQNNSLYINLYRDKYEAILKAKSYIKDEGNLKIFINNFYSKELNEEIFIFDKEKILYIQFDVKDSCLLTKYKVYNQRDIKSVELVKDTGYKQETRLIVEFEKDLIEMNNMEEYVEEEIDKKKEINEKLLEGIFEFLVRK